MITIWLVVLGITFVLCMKRTIYGCCMLVYARILIPDIVRLTPLADISLNTGIIGVIGVFLFRDLLFQKVTLNGLVNDKYIRNILFFAILLLLSILLGTCLNFSNQIGYLKQYFITDLFPAIAVVASIRNNEDARLLLKSVLIAVLINTVYGIFTVIIGANPYLFFLNLYYASDLSKLIDDSLSSRSGIIGTSSTFRHANFWGTFLPLAFVLVFYYYRLTKKKLFLWATIFTSICIFMCTKRTAMVAFFLTLLAYFWYANPKVKKNIIIYSFIGLLGVLLLVYFIPQMESAKNLIESSLFFWDDSLRDKHDVGGSSMSMRIDQTLYPWVMISDNILFGHGFGFTAENFNTFGLHPVMANFETILAQAVCNGGFLGIFTWIYFFVFNFNYSKNSIPAHLRQFPKLLNLCALAIAVANGLDVVLFYFLFNILMKKSYLINDYK